MNKLGIGLYSLAGVYGPKDRAEIERMLLRAQEWGVTFFDVANQYGPAEEVLGAVLAPYREKIKISTKVGLTAGGGRNCSPGYIFTACKESLQRLQTEYLDYYQIHFDDPSTPVEETVGALEKLRKEGLIREYNIGHLPLGKVQEYVLKGNPSAVMMELSPVAWRQYRKLKSFCGEHGLKILAMGTAGRGLLTGKIRGTSSLTAHDIRRIDPLFQRRMLESALRVVAKVEELGKIYGKTPVQVALNWLSELPEVEVVLSGPSTVAHLEENLGAFGWGLTEEHKKELDYVVEIGEKEQKQGQLADLQEILMSDLAEDGEQIVRDLVYAIAGLIELEIAVEKDLLPLFEEVFTLRKRPGSRERMEEIKAKLAGYLA